MASILAVDDNARLLSVVVDVLTSAGHMVKVAANGREATNLIQRNKFDLILTDLYMPEKDGLEILLELRKKSPNLKVIVMSGGATDYHLPNSLHIATALGAVKTISKPFSMDVLIDAVNSELHSSH